MESLLIIPARGGSKGIPRKNLAPVGGKPLIAWTIEAALASECGRVVVSTDDPEIAEVSRIHGAEVPFLRPPHLSHDTAMAIDVVLHAIEWHRTEKRPAADWVIFLQPTSPLRTADDICQGLQLARESSAPAVVAVTEAVPHPWLARQITSDGTLAPFFSESKLVRRQDFPAAYTVNGALYVNRGHLLQTTRSFEPGGTRPFVMPPERSLDIDTPFDLRLADFLLHEQTN